MTTATMYLKNQIDNAYDEAFVCNLDDAINAENTVKKILATTYSNADYKYLNAYAETSRMRLYDEIGF